MINFSELTALHASSEEVTEWFTKNNPGKVDVSDANSDGENRLLQSQEASSSGSNLGGSAKYSFICECFFMTARVLNLGLIKGFSDFKHLVQVLSKNLLTRINHFCLLFQQP